MAALSDQFPDLDASQAQQGRNKGVYMQLKAMEKHYGRVKSFYLLKERADVPDKIAEWMQQETHKVMRRGGGQQRLTGTGA
jgi:hypothetical protein